MVFSMKIISWNVRGLGGFEKRREIFQLVREKKTFYSVYTRDKLAKVDDFVCKSIWSNANVRYSFQPSLGASGGLVTLWDNNEVEVWLMISFYHVLVILGRFVKSNEMFVLFNVYAPCEVTR